MDAFLGLDHSFLLVQSGASNSFYRLRNPVEGKSASCCKFARAAIFAAPCDTCCIATTFSVTFQLHCLQLVASTFCDFAFVSLVCIAQICGGASWSSPAMVNTPPLPARNARHRDFLRAPSQCTGCAHEHIRRAQRASQLCTSCFASCTCMYVCMLLLHAC